MNHLENAKFGTRPDMPPLQELQAWYNIIRRYGITQYEVSAIEITELLKKTKAIKK